MDNVKAMCDIFSNVRLSSTEMFALVLSLWLGKEQLNGH